MDDHDIFKLSIQSALVGTVTDKLYAVSCGIRRKHLVIEAYFDGFIRQEDQELARSITNEVLADFPAGYTAEHSCYSVQDVQPKMLDFWAFLRSDRRFARHVPLSASA